ncbi:MAG: serine/threonine protein phosphatase [Xanthomonadales bacterium]|nr:serine/threonine protein phosphatase [Xanthomonadales bacterium]
MAQRLLIDSRPVWVKQYPEQARRVLLRALDLVARTLGVEALRPPPHHGGDIAKSIEKRRLDELRMLDVRVPEVLGEGRAMLVLSEIGSSLSSALKRAADAASAERLLELARAALVDVHRRGGYIGQPLPRNMTVSGDDIGFLDFEEDPREVMSLHDAQVRDWIVFAHGVAGYRRDGGSAWLARGLADVDPDIAVGVRDAASHLRRLESWLRPFLTRDSRLLASLQALTGLLATTLGLALALAVDLLHDGEIDLIGFGIALGGFS